MKSRSLILLLLLISVTSCGGPRRSYVYVEPAVVQRPVVAKPCAPRPAPTPPPCTPPAAPVSAPVKRQPPMQVSAKTPVVLLDPGHGGDDFGAKSLDKPVYHEKNLTLIATRFLQGYLNQMGITTVMTRNKDVFVELDRRAELASEEECQLFVSIHFNAASSRQADGIEVYYYDSDTDKKRTKASKALAESVLAPLIEATGAKSRGVKHGNYLVIRETETPAILIEGGFLTNAEEMTKIKDPVYLKRLAHGVALGIANYVKRTTK